ncbi:hypothetical protein [uncultured Campylobacter sp.]|uniref:hypothetical protein n=1 Tax=uncultured Campylobacter sp. TaxID=218934 RepID=UPI00261606CB|nr:hypothetical protein [uncultured Campylobacter sp.]
MLLRQLAHAKHERRGCLTKASNDAQGVSRKISNDDALQRVKLCTNYRSTQYHDADATRTVSIPTAHGKGWMMRITRPKRRMPRRIQNDARYDKSRRIKQQGSHFTSAQIKSARLA